MVVSQRWQVSAACWVVASVQQPEALPALPASFRCLPCFIPFGWSILLATARSTCCATRAAGLLTCPQVKNVERRTEEDVAYPDVARYLLDRVQGLAHNAGSSSLRLPWGLPRVASRPEVCWSALAVSTWVSHPDRVDHRRHGMARARAIPLLSA